MTSEAPYEQDFYAWTQDQARRLRDAAAARTNLPIDFEHLAEEVEDLGRSNHRALNSALARVLEHLLKLEYSPARYPRAGWRGSVRLHRMDANAILDDSPSLYGRLDLSTAWRHGRSLAGDGLAEDGIKPGDLPDHCPYTLEQVQNEDWWPQNRHGIRDPE